MIKFHGVATRYLGNYMAWHVFYEQAKHLTDTAVRNSTHPQLDRL
jgi:hypothetical protein